MITLFVIVVVATLVLAATRAEGMRPLGLALVGMISLVLGARATAVFTEVSLTPLVSSIVFAQEAATDDSTVEATTEAAATSDDADTSSRVEAESPSPAGSDQESGEQATSESSTEDAAETVAVTEPAGGADAPAGQPESEAAPAAESSATSEPESPEPVSSEPESSEPESSEPAENSSAAPAESAAQTVEEAAAPQPAARPLATPIDVKPVTVEPVTNVEYLDRDDDAPKWLETKPWTDDGVYFVPVASQLQISEADRDQALDQEMKKATNAYINRYLKNRHATTLLKLRSPEAIPKVMGSFQEQVVVTAGTMHQSHVLLSFDKDFHDAVTMAWDEVRATSRLMQTGLGAGIVILLLSTMFSYFKLDTATRGYYTGRLQFAAAAAILAVIAVSVLFANYVPWM